MPHKKECYFHSRPKRGYSYSLYVSSKGDVILIAGKGHETYQEINGVKHHFDDHEVVREIFGLQ